MKEGGRTCACPWWEGVGGYGEGALPPLENEKRKGEYRPQSAVGGKIEEIYLCYERPKRIYYPADI